MFLGSGPSAEHVLSLCWWNPWCSCNVEKKELSYSSTYNLSCAGLARKMEKLLSFIRAEVLVKAPQKALSCEQLAAGLTGCSQVVIHVLWQQWIITASLSTLTLAWGFIQASFWTWNKRDCPFCCQSWAVGAEVKLHVCNRVRCQLAVSFNFRSRLRKSCFSFLADETNFACCQITLLQVCFGPCACFPVELLHFCDLVTMLSKCYCMDKEAGVVILRDWLIWTGTEEGVAQVSTRV